MTERCYRLEDSRPSLLSGEVIRGVMLGRKVLIDRERCDGCGLCVTACHEGAIGIVDGKAALVREDVCDGLGDCLPACPMGAISFVDPEPPSNPSATLHVSDPSECLMAEPGYQWPIQIALVPTRSPHYKGTLVIAADCTAFAMDGFRERFIGHDPVMIGCPKLDDRQRFGKLSAVLAENPIDRVRVVRMEVPCCRMLTALVKSAVEESERDIEIAETVISRSGSVI